MGLYPHQGKKDPSTTMDGGEDYLYSSSWRRIIQTIGWMQQPPLIIASPEEENHPNHWVDAAAPTDHCLSSGEEEEGITEVSELPEFTLELLLEFLKDWGLEAQEKIVSSTAANKIIVTAMNNFLREEKTLLNKARDAAGFGKKSPPKKL